MAWRVSRAQVVPGRGGCTFPLGAWRWLLLGQREPDRSRCCPQPLSKAAALLPFPCCLHPGLRLLWVAEQLRAPQLRSDTQTCGVPLFAWMSSQVAAHLQLRTSCRSKAADWPAKKTKYVEDQGVACASAE